MTQASQCSLVHLHSRLEFVLVLLRRRRGHKDCCFAAAYVVIEAVADKVVLD